MLTRIQGNQNLIPFDPEIEAPARRRGKEAGTKKRTEVATAEGDNRVLRDYTLPQALGITSSIVSPIVEANNFKLSPALISFVEREQFGGHPLENPNMMEQFIAAQTKTNESLSASNNLLTSKIDAMATHQNAMSSQITQIAQQVSHLFRPQGHLPGQTETNLRCHVYDERKVEGELGDGSSGDCFSS